MSKIVPISPDLSALNTSRARASEHVTVDEWTDIIEQLHYLWSRAGARAQAHNFPEVYKTDSDVFTQLTTSGDYNLKTVYPIMLPLRRSNDGGNLVYTPRMVFYGRYIDLRATLIRFNGGSTTSLGTVTGSTPSGDWEWVEVPSVLDLEEDHHVSGSTANPVATLGVFYEARRTEAVVNAELFVVQWLEEIATATLLPLR